jgi:amidohydrolase
MSTITRTATMTDLKALIADQHTDLTAIRRDLHAHPQLMFEEHHAASVIVSELERLGIEHKTGLARGTGVLAHLPATTSRPGATSIGLRADMDALPIEERTGAPYTSTNPGVMHACGHDGHITVLLGAARVLSMISERPNPVTFVFQPAEEGGAGGAKMCEDGCLEGEAGRGFGPPVSQMYGLHGWPQFPVGVVATRPGPLLAATDEITITVRGVQCHGAYPHHGADPIVAASAIITALQTIASRNVAPLDSIVVSIGAIHAGTTANNVIPETAHLIGTVRTLRDETRALAKKRVFEIVEHTAKAMGCTAEIDWEEGYPVTRNDPKLTDHLLAVARNAFGEDRVAIVQDPTMGGEDFSFYGQHVPACFFLLGLCPEGADPATVPQLHQPTFDFNDDAIPVGVEMMCRLALSNPQAT